MKSFYIWLVILIVGLSSCGKLNTTTPIAPTAVNIEVTRIVQVTTTPLPPKTSTLIATLRPEDWQSTQTAFLVGTPVVASFECYQTAFTQLDMNNCSTARKDELEEKMEELLKALKGFHSYSEEDLQTFLRFQNEWEDFIQRECIFRSGNYPLSGDSGTLKGGSMARMSYNECLVHKYQDRLRELQILLAPEG
ncbi:MAG TPA: hypothetical protein DCG54_10000 [Anaerolineae bacterium]|jgi:uncharacterized protein YecT (DUF1311 family)|nr:hypothetical protein [Anaerolineae bacterium]